MPTPPTVLYVGPFHHNRFPRLHNMERHKFMYCKAFLKHIQKSLDRRIHYVEAVKFERVSRNNFSFLILDRIQIIKKEY